MSKKKTRCIGIFAVLAMLVIVNVTSYGQEFGFNGQQQEFNFSHVEQEARNNSLRNFATSQAPNIPPENWIVSNEDPSFIAGWNNWLNNRSDIESVIISLEGPERFSNTQRRIASEGGRFEIASQMTQHVMGENTEVLDAMGEREYSQAMHAINIAVTRASAASRIVKEFWASALTSTGEAQFVWAAIMVATPPDVGAQLAQLAQAGIGGNQRRANPSLPQRNRSEISEAVSDTISGNKRVERLWALLDAMDR